MSIDNRPSWDCLGQSAHTTTHTWPRVARSLHDQQAQLSEMSAEPTQRLWSFPGQHTAVSNLRQAPSSQFRPLSFHTGLRLLIGDSPEPSESEGL